MNYNVTLFRDHWIVTRHHDGKLVASLHGDCISPELELLDDVDAFNFVCGLLCGIDKGLN